MPTKKYGALSSSIDPTQLSLSVESAGKVVIGLIAWFLVQKGMDATTATTQLQAILDLIANAIPMAFTLWNSCMTAYGLVRKVIVAVSQTTPPASTN